MSTLPALASSGTMRQATDGVRICGAPMIVGTGPDPGADASSRAAVGADHEHLGLSKGADEERAVRVRDDVAEIAIERQGPGRGAARRGQRHELAPRAGHVHLVRVLLVGEPARRRADRPAGAHGPRASDRW